MTIECTHLPDLPNGPTRKLAPNDGEPILAFVLAHDRDNLFDGNGSLVTWGNPHYTTADAARTVPIPRALAVHQLYRVEKCIEIHTRTHPCARDNNGAHVATSA